MSKFKKGVLAFSLLLSTAMLSAQEFKRDIQEHVFVPKGQWILGSSVSYSQSSNDDYNFLIAEGIKGNTYSFKLSPVIAYAFKDNMAGGGRFMYKRSLTRVDNADINFNEDMSFTINDMYKLSHSYSGMAILRNYINLGTNTRFALYNETQVELGGSQSKLLSGKGDALTGTFEKSTNFNLAISPGLVAFINNYMAVEVNVGVLGYSFNKVRQVTDQVEVGERSSSKGSFKINVLSFGLGIAFYL